jgi:hypothetical protein
MVGIPHEIIYPITVIRIGYTSRQIRPAARADAVSRFLYFYLNNNSLIKGNNGSSNEL